MEGSSPGRSESPIACCSNGSSGNVKQIRQQWAVHEDEALAYRLQKEESMKISSHYSGNRHRNAIVREDAPKARAEQQKEEEEALEARFRQLSILQQQAEEDARLAKLLSESLEADADVDDIDFDILDKDIPGNIPNGAINIESELSEPDFFELRRQQEAKDEEIARHLQENIEKYEKEKILAIEAKDRELAKHLYEKEKAKLKRAKERARMKAELHENQKKCDKSDTEASSCLSSSSPECRSYSRCRSSVSPSSQSSSHTVDLPPRIPEKLKAIDRDDPIHFRAVPKPLPEQPKYESNNSRDPVPPYMPIHGFQIQKKKK